MSTATAPTTSPTSARDAALPPGPSFPALLQGLLWMAQPVPFMRWCRRRYGDTFTVGLPLDGDFVYVSNPADVKAVFTASPDSLHAGEANRNILQPFLGDKSVLVLDGAEHMRQRKLMLPSFHGERMQRYGDLITAIADAEVDRWQAGRVMALEPSMQAITLDVILRAVFGLDEGPRLTELRARLRRLIDAAKSPVRIIPSYMRSMRKGREVGKFARLMAMKADVDALLYEEIARRRERADLAERDDILSLLIQARDDNGEPMSDIELRDELTTLLAAGHETTATALAWFFDLVLRNPHTLQRLQEELARGETDYLDAAIRETLRLRHVVPIVVRKLLEPLDLTDYRLPASVNVACNIVLIHRREDLYPDPEQFRPERFLGRNPDMYTWIPFGGGVRRCLGASFAIFEMRSVIPVVLARARLRPASSRQQRIRRRMVTLAPSQGTRVVVEELRPAA